MLIKIVTDDGSTHTVNMKLEDFEDKVKYGGDDYLKLDDNWVVRTNKIMKYKVESDGKTE